MKIEFFTDRFHNKVRIYPANEEAKDLLGLVGAGDRKTFHREELLKIKRLGHEVVQVPNPKLVICLEE